jgi:hypothetical protein
MDLSNRSNAGRPWKGIGEQSESRLSMVELALDGRRRDAAEADVPAGTRAAEAPNGVGPPKLRSFLAPCRLWKLKPPKLRSLGRFDATFSATLAVEGSQGRRRPRVSATLAVQVGGAWAG